jgi:murein DD-endopeptidase MepM/ murein hydrolase activator NlpD
MLNIYNQNIICEYKYLNTSKIFTQSFYILDPMFEKYPSISPYTYCANNPVILVDPDGERPWPILAFFKGHAHRHENNFGASRPNGRTHKGVDFNHTGGGNTDLGAPIVATHDGYVSRIEKIGDGDKNAGGTRITITSTEGTVSSSYMHLSEVGDFKVGDKIYENQEIGKMGGSGFGKENAYTSHLHYELKLNNEKINPIGSDGNPIDPQLLLNPNEVFSKTPEQSTTSKASTQTQSTNLHKIA